MSGLNGVASLSGESGEPGRPLNTWRAFWRLAMFRPGIVALDLTLRTLFSVTFQAEGLVIRRFSMG